MNAASSRIAGLSRIALASAWTGALAVVAITTVSLGSRVGDHTMPRVWLRVVFRIFGIALDVQVDPAVDLRGRYVFVSNHQSALDGLALILALRNVPRFVGKKEIARIPLIGLAWRKLGHILIDRERPGHAWKTLEDAAHALRDSYSVYFAPEGTRRPAGALGAFRSGAFVYARAAGLPVVPVAIIGSGRLWPPGTLQIRPGTVRLIIGAPFDVADVDEARERARNWIAEQLQLRE